MKLALDMGVLEVHADTNDIMVPKVRGKLAGFHSLDLAQQVKKMKKVEKYQNLIRFFNQQDGDRELTEMLSIMAGQGPTSEGDSSTRVFHIQDS